MRVRSMWVSLLVAAAAASFAFAFRRRSPLDRPDLWKHLSESREWVLMYHGALWEEERHYAWWVSIILPALLVAYVAPGIASDTKRVIVIAGALIGLILSLLAQHIVHIEGNNFSRAMWRHEAAARAVGLTVPRKVEGLGNEVQLYQAAYAGITSEDAAEAAGNKLVRIRRGKRGARMGIRSSFRLTFILFVVVYIALMAFVWAVPPPVVAK